MSPAQAAPALTPFAIFRNRSFALLWSAEFVSSMGSALTSLAICLTFSSVNFASEAETFTDLG
jgi:hypothetical protein